MEKTSHLQRIESLREKVAELLAAAPVDALNWKPVVSSDAEGFNSLAALAAHIAGTESYWISEVIGKRPSFRDRDAEFAAKAENSEPLVEMLRHTGRETKEIMNGLADGDLDRTIAVQGENPTVRWILMQVETHTAMHYGQMQMTYQLWNNGKMFADVRWKEFLPNLGNPNA